MVILFFLYVKSGQLLLLASVFLLLVIPFLSLIWNEAVVRVSGMNAADGNPKALKKGPLVKPRLQILKHGAKGEESAVGVTIFPMKLPVLGKYYVGLRLTNELTGEVERRIQPLHKGAWSMVLPHCGRMNYDIEKLWLTDYLGIIPRRLRSETSVRMTILPETFPVNVDSSMLLSAAEDSDLYESDRRGNDPTEIFQLREYAAGDMVRSIHWKLSSKLDQLIVKEPAMPVDRSLLIYWDQSVGSPAVLDTLAETVFSLCQALSGMGCAYTLGWMEDGFLRLAEISDMDALLEHLPMLLHRKAGPLQSEPDFTAWGKVLYFTGGLTEASYESKIHTFLCLEQMEAVDGVTVFTPDNYKEKLEFSYEY